MCADSGNFLNSSVVGRFDSRDYTNYRPSHNRISVLSFLIPTLPTYPFIRMSCSLADILGLGRYKGRYYTSYLLRILFTICLLSIVSTNPYPARVVRHGWAPGLWTTYQTCKLHAQRGTVENYHDCPSLTSLVPCSSFSLSSQPPPLPPCSLSKRDVSTNHPMIIFYYSRKASPFSRYVSSITVTHLETALDTYVVAHNLPSLPSTEIFTAGRPSNPVALEWAIDHIST